MKRFCKLIPTVGLTAGLGLSMAFADGQPPAGEKKGPPPGERGGQPPGGPGGPGGGFPGGPGGPGGRPGGEREPRPDPAVDAWVKMLADKMTDPHDVIRESARAGLVAAGPAAAPTLRKLADSEDGAKATAARRVLQAIEQRPQPGMGGPPMLMQRQGGAPAAAGDRRPGGLPGAGRQPDGDRRPDGPPGAGRQPEGDRRPDGPPGAGRPDGNRRPMNDLGLNEKQQKQIEAIQQAAQKKLREVREQVEANNLDPMDARKKTEAIREALLKEAKEVLTAEQFEKFQERMPTPGRRPMERKE